MSGRVGPKKIGMTPDVAFKRAVVLQQNGDLLEAEKIYRALLKKHTNHFGTLLNLAWVLLMGERTEEAIRFLRKALNQQPNSAAVYTQLARALGLLDRHEEALERARRAIALDPNLPEAHAILAQLLANLGRYDEAILVLERAIKLAPDQPLYYRILGHITRWAPDDPRLAALKHLAQKSQTLPLSQQVELNFALAKAYADCGDVEVAFRCQVKGGRLYRQSIRYDETSTLHEWEELSRALDTDWMARHLGVGDPSPLPVFILGMPRSGSTLVEQILASHPKAHALGERLIFVGALAQMCGMSYGPPSVARQAARWSGAELRKLGMLYREAIQRHTPAGATRAIDKLPANFQYVGLIHAALPNARIIHTRRDPLDTCLSIFSIFFSGVAQPYSYDLGELGRYYRAYENLMSHWRNVLPAGILLEVQYEELVEDFERQARRIIAHCGLEWDDACLEFHKTNRAVRTISHAQVRQPIYRSSVGRPRPPRALVAPLLEALGVDY